MLPAADKILRETSVNVYNLPSIYKNKRVCVKLVDCDKHPWYYTKYEKQILKRKYCNALKHAESIAKYQNNSAEDPVINVDELSDSEDDSNDQNMHKRASHFWKTSFVEQQFMKQKEEKKKLNDGKINNMLKEAIEKGTNSLIDIKKNKGLIGMKVKKIEITYKENRKQKKKSYKIHLSRKKRNQKRSLEKLIDAAECDNSNSENQTQDDNSTVQKFGKSKLKHFSNLTCSLRFTAPKIYMKIKKNKPKNEVVENLHNDSISDMIINTTEASKNYTGDAASSITTKKHELEKFILSHHKETKYKPMPKSKKVALKQQTSANIDENNLVKKREIESSLNILNKSTLVVSHKNKHKNEAVENVHNGLISGIVTNTAEASENYKDAVASSITTKNQEMVKLISSDHKETKYKPMPKSKRVALQKQTSTNIDQNNFNKKTELVSCPNSINKSTLVKPQLTTDSIKNKTKTVIKSYPGTYKLKRDKNNSYYDSTLKKGNRKMTAKPNEESEPERFDSFSMIKNIDNQSSVLLSSQNKKRNDVALPSPLITVAKMDDISMSHNEIHHVKNPEHNTYNTCILCDSVSSEKTNIIMPNVSPSSKSNENQSSLMSNNKDNIIKTQSDKSLHLKSPFHNDSYSETSENPNIQTLLTLPQNPPEPQEYILPDVIHPPTSSSDFIYKRTRTKEPENHIKEYQTSSTSPPVLCSLINIVPPPVNSGQKSVGRISSDNNIEKTFPINAETNTNHISINSKVPQLFRTPIMPNMRPNILRQPIYKLMSPGCPVQQQYSSAQVLPPFNRPLVDILPFNRPSFNRPPPPPYTQRRQSLKIVRSREYYPYPKPSIVYPPTAANKVNQQEGIHYIRHNYPQQPVYKGENIHNLQNNAHGPPGICNVLPNYSYLPQNCYNPAYPPPQPPPSPTPLPVQLTTNSDNSSIIGKNASGIVKKINILSTANKQSSMKINILKNKKDNEASLTNKNTQKITLDNKNVASTKSEMIKELQMALKAEIEDSIQKESNTQCTKETSICKLQNPVSETVKAVCKGSVEKVVKLALPDSSQLEFKLDSKKVRPIIGSVNWKLEVMNSVRETMNVGSKRKNHEMEQVLNAMKFLKMNTELTQPQPELIYPELNKPFTNDPRTKQNNMLRDTRPEPLSKKLNNSVTKQPRKNITSNTKTNTKITTKMSNNGYSPPILPIPTYQNILSEVHIRPSNRKLFGNSFVAPNINKTLAKKVLQNNLTKTCKQLKSTTYDTKKISLDEYKKRSTKLKNNN